MEKQAKMNSIFSFTKYKIYYVYVSLVLGQEIKKSYDIIQQRHCMQNDNDLSKNSLFFRGKERDTCSNAYPGGLKLIVVVRHS